METGKRRKCSEQKCRFRSDEGKGKMEAYIMYVKIFETHSKLLVKVSLLQVFGSFPMKYTTLPKPLEWQKSDK